MPTKLKLPKFYFEDFTNEYQWDNFEISPIWDDGNGNVDVVDDDKDATYFSVFVHLIEGGRVSIADFATRQEAEKAEEFFTTLVSLHVKDYEI